MAQFNVHDPKSNVSLPIDMALEDGEVLISRHGITVAQLTAIREASRERIPGAGRGSVIILAPDWDERAAEPAT